jgi:TonB family protein
MKKAFVLIALSLLIMSCKNNKSEEKNFKSKNDNISSSDSISPSDTLISNTETVIETLALSDVFKQLKKVPQVFSVVTSKDTTLICKEGTRITIKANSFIKERTKQAVIGSVKIAVTEYYKMSDIILAKLSTSTNGKMLETGGMLNITANSNNDNCILKSGSPISIGFPSKKRKENMELYNGVWKDENTINWVLDKNAFDLNKIYSEVDQKPIYPGGINSMYRFISANINPDEETTDGKVIVSFIVDKTGTATDVKIIKSLNKTIDKQVISVIRRLPKFIPGKINGEPVNVYYTLPIQISGSDVMTESTAAKISLDKKYTDATLKNASTIDVTVYLFQSSGLGWINCDRLWENNSAPAVDYLVDVHTKSDASVNIVFHKYESVLSGNFSTDRYIFKKLPSHEKVTIVAIKRFSNSIQLAVKETEIGETALNDLVFKTVTFNILKEELKKIDKI